MKIYKLEVTKDLIKCVDVLDDIPKKMDNKYIYATESDMDILDKSKIDFSEVSLDTSFLE